MKKYDGTNYPKSLDADLVGEINCILFRPRQLPKTKVELVSSNFS
jgi:hypothetical protein